MKYKPLHSNFAELQDEVMQRILEAHNSIESLKDAIAQEIDEYVEAVLKEHVEEANVWTVTGDKSHPIEIMFCAGDKKLPSGDVDVFARKVPLTHILDDFNWWDELDEFEPESITNLADKLQAFADRLRLRAKEIADDNA